MDNFNFLFVETWHFLEFEAPTWRFDFYNSLFNRFLANSLSSVFVSFYKIVLQSFASRGNDSQWMTGFSYVQWGPNQDGVFEIVVKEISMLLTLTTSRELKNWYFITNFVPHHHLYVNNTFVKFWGQKIHQKNVIQNLPTWVAEENFSLLPTLIAFQGLKKKIAMNFLEQKLFYVNKICSKFQGPKIHTKKYINNLPTCVSCKGQFQYYQLQYTYW